MRHLALKAVRWAFFQSFGRTKGEILYSQLSGPLGDWIESKTPETVRDALNAVRLVTKP